MAKVENNEVIYFPGTGEPVIVSEEHEHKVEETAIGLAREAYNLQKSHEKICELRWNQYYASQKALLDAVKQINDKFWSLAIGLILTLLAVCGTLITIFVLK
jgi:hypothetical protein